jgi:hypothetical protein
VSHKLSRNYMLLFSVLVLYVKGICTLYISQPLTAKSIGKTSFFLIILLFCLNTTFCYYLHFSLFQVSDARFSVS